MENYLQVKPYVILKIFFTVLTFFKRRHQFFSKSELLKENKFITGACNEWVKRHSVKNVNFWQCWYDIQHECNWYIKPGLDTKFPQGGGGETWDYFEG